MRRFALVMAIVIGLSAFSALAVRAAWAGDSRAERVPILLYHHIVAGDPQAPLEVGAASFARQMSYMKLRNYHFAASDEIARFVAGTAQLPDPTALVTFDDGFEDNYTVAFPILKNYGIKATIFVITSRVGTPGYLTADQIAEMHASGLVDFQLHTDSLHYKTSDGQSAVLTVPPETLIADLNTARAKLAVWTGQLASSFAYPFGFFNDAVAEPLVDANVVAAYTVEPGYVRRGDNALRLHRIPVFGTLRQRYLFRFIGGLENLRFK